MLLDSSISAVVTGGASGTLARKIQSEID